MALTLDGDNGISGINGSATTPAVQGTDTNTGLTFGTDTVGVVTDGTTRTTVDSSGRLLVGTSSSIASTSRLQVAGGDLSLYHAASGATAGYSIYFATDTGATARVKSGITNSDTSGAGGTLLFFTTADGASSPTERMRITNGGQLTAYATTHGMSSRSGSASSSSIEVFHCARSATSTTNGTDCFAVYTNGSYATLSDQTQKKNIETTRDGYLSDLNRLRVVKYNWNEQEDNEPKELGLIAQEVEQVFPGLISLMRSENEETGEQISTKGVKYSVLPVMLLKALQEADQKIEAQSALIESQAATIAALDARLTALEGGAA